jgi:hypothetical protein
MAEPFYGLENILPSQRVSATNSAMFQSKPSSSGTFKVYQFCLAGVSRASGAFLYPRASGSFMVYQFCLAGVSRASGAFLYPRASGTFKVYQFCLAGVSRASGTYRHLDYPTTI